MGNPKKYLVTSALPYANGPLHLGHIAGAYLPADIFVRYLRSKKDDVVFVCGSDEHGAAITIKAKKEGTTPQKVVDEFHELNKLTFEKFGISFDYYDRTSAEHHHKKAQDFFTDLNNKGVFEKQEREQFYDEENKQFLADRYITGTCPKCDYDAAYGDQCEKCGSSLSPTELVNPKSTLSGNAPILKKTSHWYLPMQDHEAWLREWIENGTLDGEQLHNPKDWKNHVIGQCKSWVDGGLQSRAMTRDLDWGVKVPLTDAEGKVLYVWLDAPIGYISATNKWAELNGFDGEAMWKDKDRELVHFIGKDNIVFHCIIFPILLKLHGEYNLPKNVPANEFLNLEGDKLSTSRNWAVWLHEYMEDFPDKEDELRYVLTSILPEVKDSEFTWKDYQARINNELVAILGNFVNRALVLTHKYFEGKVPAAGADNKFVSEQIKKAYKSIDDNIKNYTFRQALIEAMNVARMGNKFLADTEPWKLIKSDVEKTGEILNTSLQIVAHLAKVIEAFLPSTSAKIFDFVGLDSKTFDISVYEALQGGSEIKKPSLLFAKIEDEQVEKQMEKLKDNKKETPTPMIEKEVVVKPNMSFDDFTRLDLKLATIKSANKIKKADRLLHLKIDVAGEFKDVVSGIAEYYTPENVIGRTVLYLANLEPRKIRGVLSQGMILMAENNKGELSFMLPEKPFESGAEVR